MEKKKNLLVTLADTNFIPQAKQLFSSVYWNAGWEGDYMLLAHDIPDTELKWFTDKGILIRKCETLFSGPMGDGNYPPTVVDKFYIFSQEFKRWEHVIFLDADIMVKAPLDGLLKTKALLSPRIMKKYFKMYFFKIDCKERDWVEKEYDLNRPSFNSGVLSFNTGIIHEDTFDKLMAVFHKYSNISNGDDSILNLFFYDHWIPVPVVYNVRVNYLGLRKCKGIVLHFQRHGSYAPLWDPANTFYGEWKSNLDKAEFIDLGKIQKARKWSSFRIKYYSLFLKACSDSRKLNPFIKYIWRTPDRLTGKAGLLIKKYNPRLYDNLKKIKGGK
jgi:lipopolysaccharide biosynthesis glycosyltransferase